MMSDTGCWPVSRWILTLPLEDEPGRWPCQSAKGGRGLDGIKTWATPMKCCFINHSLTDVAFRCVQNSTRVNKNTDPDSSVLLCVELFKTMHFELIKKYSPQNCKAEWFLPFNDTWIKRLKRKKYCVQRNYSSFLIQSSVVHLYPQYVPRKSYFWLNVPLLIHAITLLKIPEMLEEA